MIAGTHASNALLDRREVVSRLLVDRNDALVVTSLGSATYDVANVGDHDRNFYLWGAMGGAAVLGLGLALAQPDVPVIVFVGDGELLMGLGSLATIAQQRPGNLTVVVLDNELYGETGAQKTHVAYGTDLAAVARGCGIDDSVTLTTMAEVETLALRAHSVRTETAVAVIKIDGGDAPRVIPLRDGAVNRGRLRLALGLSID
ncbi:MAG: thiamine pyrophosphate-dependent enzyme [Phenylobacterium sp.]|uniref:thiamine pyrophosphate-dependent enzyme n=1 Tax=Phenylobacterium sp. TaxID=1871053 RepID=UPI00273420CA|nr:thiamine pyrophosphate-dependent enzyme [Phenylobacterium sp.]MDP3175643.1 thiamine pyrophosphate-dependent enzyme [Phenylobacterium sp.]